MNESTAPIRTAREQRVTTDSLIHSARTNRASVTAPNDPRLTSIAGPSVALSEVNQLLGEREGQELVLEIDTVSGALVGAFLRRMDEGPAPSAG